MKIARKWRVPLVVLVGVLLVVGVAGVVFLGLKIWYGGEKGQPVVERPAPVEKIPDPVAVGGKMDLLLTGTTYWGRRINELSRASELGMAYPFSQLASLEREKYDAWIGGLECPVTENESSRYYEYTLLKFNCDPDYLPEVAKWFSAFMLGTNHAHDWGEEGFLETKGRLAEAGIQSFGHFDFHNGTDNCGVVVLPVRVEYDNGSVKKWQMPLGFCSAHGVFGVPKEEAFINIRRYAEVLPTIVMPHMGEEYRASADSLRTNLFRKMIDYGADMVIADHPHWVQNSESYQGKLIVYSMGNFMFDQTFNREVARSAAIVAGARFDGAVDFVAWDKLGKKCLKDSAGCLDSIVAKALPKVTIAWEFDYKGTVTNRDCLTGLADETEQAAIGQRLKWATTLAGLRRLE